jgi:hypothetical protein
MNKVGQKVKHWTTNQGTLLDNVDKGGFSLRSKRQEVIDFIDPAYEFTFEKIVKTFGDGPNDIIELIK